MGPRPSRLKVNFSREKLHTGKGGMMLLADRPSIEQFSTQRCESPFPTKGHPNDYLVEMHLKLVYKCAHKLKRQGVLDFDELVSEGHVALIACARCPSYDPAKSKFSSYAIPSIIRKMVHAIRQKEKYRIHQEPINDRDTDHAPALDTIAQEETDAKAQTNQQLLGQVLDVLTEYEKDIFHRHIVEEYSIQAIAKKERCEIGEIRKVVEMATYKLRMQAARKRKELVAA